jgi:protein-tyrosine phosphatase
MIDLHSHILPGLDDGARNMDDSLEMAEIAVSCGVHTMAATPHANTGGYTQDYEWDEYMERLNGFRSALEREGIPLTVLPGMEIYTTPEVPQMKRDGLLFPINGSSYYLMEFAFGMDEDEMDELLSQALDTGMIPLIAHPERYRCVQESVSGLISWKKKGCLVQVNRGSILGRFGRRAKECVDELLDMKMVTCIASDAHKPYERTTFMADIKTYMEERYSFRYSRELLYENPLRILENRRV